MSILPESSSRAVGNANPPGDLHADPREVYFHLLRDGFSRLKPEALRQRLEDVDIAMAPDDPAALRDLVMARDHIGSAADVDGACLCFHAPVGLIEGAWMQRVARAHNGHQADVAALFAGYLALLGSDEAESPAAAYRGALARGGRFLPPVLAWHFARDSRIGLPALDFAILQLELGAQAARLLPEIIGFTLGYAASDSPWRLVGMDAARRRRVLGELAGHAAGALQEHLAVYGTDEGEVQWRRVRRGYALYRQAEGEYLGALQAFAGQQASPRERVGAIFRSKAEFARGYHPVARLGARRLDDWFAQEPFDTAGFLRAFAASHYVTGGADQNSFARLTGFGGPMFGIFSREELRQINQWLEVADAEDEAESPLSSVPTAPVRPRRTNDEPGRPMAKTPIEAVDRKWLRADSRELFHHLVNIERLPGALGAAQRRVEIELRAARTALRTGGVRRERFFEYTPEALGIWVARIHQEEVARYRPLEGKPRLERQEYVFGIRQFAPAILADGCWLQNACTAAQQDDRLHRLLLHIYADELGAGRTERNHPNVYRHLLMQAGIDLPEVSDIAFARDAEFLDSAFDLPVYLLAISQRPDCWLPELLGLNLAIELSGLGATYLSLADELEHWGLDPLIVRLHQSIDALAGGHAAQAVEAVQIYLERMRALGGGKSVDEHWRRVWAGYLSLGTSTRRFRWSMRLAFCARFLPGRTIRRLRSGLAQA